MNADQMSDAVALNRRQSVHEDIESPPAPRLNRGNSHTCSYLFKINYICLIVGGIIIFILACVVLSLFILSFPCSEIQIDVGTNPQGQTVCFTKSCNETGLHTALNINFSAEPCHDFEEFACGGWRKRFGQDTKSQVARRTNTVVRRALDILKHPVKEGDGVPLRLAKLFYNQCIDLMALESVGNGPLLKLLHDYGGWPSLEGPSWRPDNFSLPKSVGFANRFLQFAPFISISLLQDYSGKHSTVLAIDEPHFLLEKPMYHQSSEERTKQISDFKFKYTNLAQWLSGNHLALHSKDAMEIVSLEERLLDVMKFENTTNKFYGSPGELMRDVYGGPQTESSSELNIQSLLDEIIFTSSVAAALVDNKTALPIQVEDINYLRQLVQIIDSTPPRVLANYLHFIVASKLSEEALEYPDFSQLNDSAKVAALKERKAHCVLKSLPAFKMAIGAEYVTQHSHETLNDKELELMALNITAVFQETLAGAGWLSETFREFLLNKLEVMTIHVGYPHWILNETLLLGEYEGLSLASTYFDTVLNVTAWLTDKIFRECHSADAWAYPCGTISDIGSGAEGEGMAGSGSQFSDELPPFFKYGLLSVNAYHNRRINAIVIPTGIIGSPFYDDDEQMLMKYARMGFLIAHEIAHGMDDLGFVSAANGTMIADHLTEEDQVEVRQKRQCLAEQYADFQSTLGEDALRLSNSAENTADNVALVMAYRAYQKWIENENGGKPEPKLPHLEHWTPDELFFLVYAMTWCEMEGLALADTKTDQHSPGKLRVTVPLQNSPEFAQAWNCKVGTRMNPKRKCMDF